MIPKPVAVYSGMSAQCSAFYDFRMLRTGRLGIERLGGGGNGRCLFFVALWVCSCTLRNFCDGLFVIERCCFVVSAIRVRMVLGFLAFEERPFKANGGVRLSRSKSVC